MTTPTTIAATVKTPDAAFDGPWIVNPFCAQIDSSRVDIHGDLVPVCQMLWPTDLRSEEDTGRFARLIAAAPALLEALRDMLPNKLCGESWDLPDDETVQIVVTFGKLKATRAAISAATGEV